MKQGINTTMPVTVSGLDLAVIESIEFVFKITDNKSKQGFKTAYFSANGEGDVSFSEGLFYIPWTRAETYTVPAGTTFYLDTRIHVFDSDDNPETNIVTLVMHPTLFGVNEEVTR